MDRLLGETALFLHRVEEDLGPAVKEAVGPGRARPARGSPARRC